MAAWTLTLSPDTYGGSDFHLSHAQPSTCPVSSRLNNTSILRALLYRVCKHLYLYFRLGMIIAL